MVSESGDVVSMKIHVDRAYTALYALRDYAVARSDVHCDMEFWSLYRRLKDALIDLEKATLSLAKAEEGQR
jgi:hypothetical protein